MNYVFGGLAGLVWGVAAGLLNAWISAAALKKNRPAALMGANMARMVVDVAALAVVFLLRGVLPFPYEAALIATAVGLSLTVIVTAYRMSRDK